MGEPKNRWTWDLPGFEPRKPDEGGEDRGYRPAVRRLSVSQSSLAPRADQPKRPVAVRLQKLKNQLKVRAPCVSRPPLLPFDLSGPFMCSSFSFSVVGWRNRSEDEEEEELEEDAYCSDYSSFVTSCMGCKRRERKQNMAQKVYCRVRPPFEDEGPSIIELPDDFTIRVNTGDESLANPKRDYEFDRVYGPHVGQGLQYRIVPCGMLGIYWSNRGSVHSVQLDTLVYHVGKAPYRPVHTGPTADRYVDRPLSGDTAKIGRRRSTIDFDRWRSIEEEKGKRRRGKEERRRSTLSSSPPARCPRALAARGSPTSRRHAGRRNISPRWERDRGDIAHLFLF
ncbi:hypothetical protein BHM03_00033222 [Ensete ventricosum]|nr:hypothetical protein BHM03_00033222 [Ensete ventricosum]